MNAFTPRNPDYQQAVRDSFGRQPFMAMIGARMSEVRPGHVEIRLPFRQDLGQNHGYFHGGVVGAMADVAAGFAGFSILPRGASVLTVEYKVNMLAPGHGEEMVGRGHVLRAGGTLIITEARLFAVKDGIETLCAVALQTLRAKTSGNTATF